MKQPLNNEPATKQDIKDSEERLEKKIDTRLAESDKKFEKWLDNSIKAFRQETEHHLQMMEEKWDAKFLAFENRLLTVIDPLIKDMETRQQERAIAAAQMQSINDDITDLQKRVTKLETA